jgi:hypothetical protein
MGYSFVAFTIITVIINVYFLMKLLMKLWKNLKGLKELKKGRVVRLELAQSKVVEFMVEDIKKQMNAQLANKFKNL